MNVGSPTWDLLERSKEFALRIVRLYGALPKTVEAQVIGRQVLRSGTSVGAHLREGKRSRPDVAAFLMNLEVEIPRLRRELESGEYRPGPYRTFTIHEPKRRMISAAPFRDRVVHHALVRVLEPVFERRFTRDSYAWLKISRPPGTGP
ncbi:MAG: four helix bundle protein [Acidobacteria bacterium]|nr:four helix bundle protein [Acidobacteriota bacterium]